jgi:hypothetical protein
MLEMKSEDDNGLDGEPSWGATRCDQS